MADHGAIASSLALGPVRSLGAQQQSVYPMIPRVIRTVGGGDSSAERLSLDAGRDDVEGNPATPSISFPRGGTIRLRLAVDAGARTITIQARQPSATLPRPTARIRANAEIGLVSDLVATAPTGAGWVTIGPMAFTATANGGVFLELTSTWFGGESGCWFDTISVK